MELAPTGDKYQPKKRFKKFVNLPELMKIYKETADIQTQDMLDLPVPEAHIIPIESELTENQKLLSRRIGYEVRYGQMWNS